MRLIIFTRYPEAGRVKTRLIPALGNQGAEKLHRIMVEHTVRKAEEFRGRTELCYSGGNRRLFKAWLGDHLAYRRQKGLSLGDRIQNAMNAAFSEGENRVIIIGTDCPGLNAGLIDDAFNLLHRFELVLGPAFDGGYYLIGQNQAGFSKQMGKLFKDVSWGSDQVLQQTLVAAGKLNLRVTMLEKLADVDRPEDLTHLTSFIKSRLEPVDKSKSVLPKV